MLACFNRLMSLQPLKEAGLEMEILPGLAPLEVAKFHTVEL